VLSEGKLTVWDHVGVFTSARCFLVLHTTIEGAHFQHVIYFWQGAKSSKEERTRLVELAMEKNSQLDNVAVMVRHRQWGTRNVASNSLVHARYTKKEAIEVY